MAERGTPFTRTAALGWGLVGAAVVALVGIAAGVGSPLASPPLPNERPPGWQPGTDPKATVTATAPEHSVDESLVVVLKVLVGIFVAAVLIAIVVAVIRLFQARRRPRIQRRVLDPDEVEVLTMTLPEPIYVRPVTPVVDAFDESRTLLVEGVDPRAAIIAAWLRLEQSAEAAGVRREPTDTPTDLVARLVSRFTGAQRDLATLADTYRRARFAPAEPTERDRAVALDALSAVRDSMVGPSMQRGGS